MPIDYSKWDKIEISDDSDVEVHPNVDKKSFIKWKQRDIHEKRMQRNVEIKSILIQLTMYSNLNERVDYLLSILKPSELLDASLVKRTLDTKFDPKQNFNYEELIKDKGDTLRKGLKDLTFSKEEVDNLPPYNEMIEDLFVQIKEDHEDAKSDGNKLIEYLKEHRNKIDDVLSKQTIKLDDLLNQKAQLIVSDDLHTGFDRSFLNKDKEEDDEEEKSQTTPSSSQKETITTTETLNSPSSANVESQKPKTDKDLLDELEILPETEKFGSIAAENLSESADYLIKHTKICTESQKDALLMTAFDAQLSNDSSKAKNIIHQSLIIQYVTQLKGNKNTKDDTIRAIKLLFGKFQDKDPKVEQLFKEEYTNLVNHITKRCEIIKQEEAARAEGNEGQEEEALLQLRALDDNTKLSVAIPSEGTPEYKIFHEKLPIEFQNAIKTENIDEINKEFAKLKFEDAEKILDVFNECGVISVSGILENEEEFENLRNEEAST
ncbi:CDC37 [Candida pseudojiufengensis]|uniref:CDC37 n=1 Tax=Candida pseudojiufengensis TaxID=497109 RepID=UPI0022259CB0|nr:CDC37 [Candida pseudojiufengensis]KAI5963131.1 CDC37 [Candida pseudojiufengensis]